MHSPFIFLLAFWIGFASFAEARAIAFISYTLTRKRVPMNVGFALSAPPLTAFAIYFAKHDTYHGVPEEGFEIYLWVFCAVAFVLALAIPLIWRRRRKRPGGDPA